MSKYLEEKHELLLGNENGKEKWANEFFKPLVLELSQGFQFERLSVVKRDQQRVLMNVMNMDMDESDLRLEQLVIGISFQKMVQDFVEKEPPAYMTQKFGLTENPVLK